MCLLNFVLKFCLVKVAIQKGRSRSRSRIKSFTRIRSRIKMMWIRNTVEKCFTFTVHLKTLSAVFSLKRINMLKRLGNCACFFQ
jgi:hypothetical protein